MENTTAPSMPDHQNFHSGHFAVNSAGDVVQQKSARQVQWMPPGADAAGEGSLFGSDMEEHFVGMRTCHWPRHETKPCSANATPEQKCRASGNGEQTL